MSPHHDALVISLTIATSLVKRILWIMAVQAILYFRPLITIWVWQKAH